MADNGFAVVCSCEGTVVRVLRDDLGISAGVIPGTSFADLFDVASHDKAREFVAVLREEVSAVGWQLNVVADTRVIPLEFSGVATPEELVIAGGRARGELRENDLYEELSRLNNELINRERELAQKTITLERTAAEKNRLIAIAAHDLRNPLTVVAAYAELLRIELEPHGDAEFYLEEIVRSAQFMGELVEELLDSARLESGIIDVDLQELDLVAAARHASVINRIRADRKQIAIAFEHDVERLPIRADPVKLRQIVNNLVVNAVKFSPVRTTVTIRVKGNEERPALEVADEGIGIAPEKLDTIFQPFATLNATGTAGEKSIGLGLAIVKRLVELHEARLEVRSEESRGSCFRIEFPKIA